MFKRINNFIFHYLLLGSTSPLGATAIWFGGKGDMLHLREGIKNKPNTH